MERTCEACLDRISQKKTYSTSISMLKRNSAKEFYQMLPYCKGEYEPEQNVLDFQSAGEILMEEADEMVVKGRFEMIYSAKESMVDMKYGDIPKNKEIFLYGFKHNKKDKVDKSVLIGCESVELFEKD